MEGVPADQKPPAAADQLKGLLSHPAPFRSMLAVGLDERGNHVFSVAGATATELRGLAEELLDFVKSLNEQHYAQRAAANRSPIAVPTGTVAPSAIRRLQ